MHLRSLSRTSSVHDVYMRVRSDSWIVSGRVAFAAVAAIVAIVVVVIVGAREQDRYRIPTARSVAIWSGLTSNAGPETGPVVFGPIAAQSLAAAVNHLGRFPDGTFNCPNETWAHYRLVFTTVSGQVSVIDLLSGCNNVGVSNGTEAIAKRDDGSLSAAIRAALASTDRH